MVLQFCKACELLCATEKPDNKRIKRLIDNGRLYNAADALNNTLLHHAVTAGNHEIVKYLVDSGSDVNVRNNFESTPLVSTLKTKFPCKYIIQILLQARANIDVKDKSGKSALNIVESSISLTEDTEWIEIYKMFLETAKYFECFNLLQNGNEKIINMLMQTNVNVLLKDRTGISLVHVFARNKNPGIMALIRSKSNFNINLRCKYNRWTPLMYATLYHSTNAMEFLLDEGADIEAVDDAGQTALYIAYSAVNFNKVNKNCVQVLLERGANPQIQVARHFSSRTIFDLVLRHEDFAAGELMLAQLALQEAKGTEISQIFRRKIDSHSLFQNYFDYCKQQLPMTVDRSITLFDVLAAGEKKMKRYLRDKELTSKLLAFKTVEYFDTLKRKRLLKAELMIDLRKIAAPIISKLLVEIDYDRYPSILDEIASYLGEKDIKCLISIQSKLSN